MRWTVFEPLTDTQLWVLDRVADLYPAGEFFFSAKGKIHNRIYQTLKAACKKLEIPYGMGESGGFVIHDTRHTFVTILEQGAVDSSTTRSFSGHSREAMLKRYAHATFGSRARAMQIIEKEIGNGNSEKNEELKRIFEAVAAGRMKFAEFKKAVEDSFTVF